MNFASLQFLFFFLAVFGVYWCLRKSTWQNYFLIACSYYFYACWDVRFLALIVLVTVVSHSAANRLFRGDLTAAQRVFVLKAFLIFSLVLLGVFKYFNFFADSMVALLNSVGLEQRRIHLDILLPAAISFYIFESISHVVGAYKRELKIQPTLLEYSLFIAFFPKLVAGPIERPNVLQPQLRAERTLTLDKLTGGAFLVLLGLVKKVAIADGLAPSVSAVFDSSAPAGSMDVALATLAFALQIYGDFSGYSDIARGVALMLGIELSGNFRFPYFSKNPSEFWRRWHISLSTWLRDYLYVPLGGNRNGSVLTYRNLFLTMLIGGLWHGAAWTYVAWGAYQGALLCIHRVLRPVLDGTRKAFGAMGAPGAMAYSGISLLTFFLLTCYGWLLFRAVSFEQVASFTYLLAVPTAGLGVPMPPLSALLGVPVVLLFDALAYRADSDQPQLRWHPMLAGLLHALLFVLVLMGLANSRAAFIYFQF